MNIDLSMKIYCFRKYKNETDLSPYLYIRHNIRLYDILKDQFDYKHQKHCNCMHAYTLI